MTSPVPDEFQVKAPDSSSKKPSSWEMKGDLSEAILNSVVAGFSGTGRVTHVKRTG